MKGATTDRSRRLRFGLSVPLLVPCLVAAGALALLLGCGGDSPEPDASGPATEETNGGGSAESAFLKCDTGGECTDAPPECEKSSSCIAVNCGAESGGCVPAIGKGRGGLFGTRDSLRLCFDLQVVQTNQKPSTSDPSQTTNGAAETGTTDTDESDTTDTEEAETTDTEEAETATTTNSSTGAETVEGDTTAECSGPSFPVSGIDPATIEDKLSSSSDGQVVWSQEDISLLGKIVDGEFRVSSEH